MKTARPASAEQKKGKGKNWLGIGIGALALGLLSFFGFRYFTQNKEEGKKPKAPRFPAKPPKDKPRPPASKPAPKNTVPKVAPKAATRLGDEFPLKKGSWGEHVKKLQQALLDKHGPKMLKGGKADGIFGSDTAAALKRLNLPEIIDETIYNVLVQEKRNNPAQTAKAIYQATIENNFGKVQKLLKTIKNPDEYNQVNTVFKAYFLNGVRHTLVNGLLSTFKTDAQKQALNLAFAAMGLKYDGEKWSLSGADEGPKIITTEPALVWKDPNTSVPVPANMVLGRKVAQRGSFTLFENDKQFFLVETKKVNAYKA